MAVDDDVEVGGGGLSLEGSCRVSSIYDRSVGAVLLECNNEDEDNLGIISLLLLLILNKKRTGFYWYCFVEQTFQN